MNGYVIFSDLKGFSKLTEPEIRIFYKNLIPRLHNDIIDIVNKSLVRNTWGDAIVAVFENGKDATDFALVYRNFFRNFDFASLGISKLLPRIACHFGEFEFFDDPLLGNKNILGTNINTTARIEPVTKAGEIFVTKPFKDAIKRLPEKIVYVRFDEFGDIPLAKNFGKQEIFRMHKSDEKAQIVDRLLRIDLSWALPEAPEILNKEKDTIEFYKKCPGPEKLLTLLGDESFEEKSGEFLLRIADICKKFGLYPRALEFIKLTEEWSMDVNGVRVHPYKYNHRLLTLKANCLTRIGMYEEAAEIVYGLWQAGLRNSDTLSMLAAQYKRRAIINGSEIRRENLNIDLFIRAKDLYLEAFRINVEDYYPAINAAYLYKIIGGIEEGKGIKLSTYITSTWGDREGTEWWLDTTLAEAEIIQGDIEEAETKMAMAIEKHKPDYFQLKSVHEQIDLYSQLTNNVSNLKNILKMLA